MKRSQRQTVPAGTPRTNRLSDAPSAVNAAFDEDAHDSLAALRSFVAPEDLSVVFQPIIDITSGRTFAYEALVRCRVVEYKNPIRLFEKAVELGCAGRLGRMIREIGVPHGSGKPLFVNIHPKELSEGWLVRPDDPILSHDDDVYLEVTESVPLSHYELCMSVLKEVVSHVGVHLVVDDLGAGYSNLKRISDLEPKVVKLDRDLIMGLDRSRRQQELVTAVVDLCRRLGATVVAEGIETHDEYSAVLDTGTEYGQGFLFARPSFPPPEVSFPPAAETTSVRKIRG